MIQVLTHVREKLHFMVDRIQNQKELLEDKADELTDKKAELQVMKSNCSLVQQKTETITRRCMRVTNSDLLEDIQKLQDQKVSLKKELERLQGEYASMHG